jgi:hypothetical protein
MKTAADLLQFLQAALPLLLVIAVVVMRRLGVAETRIRTVARAGQLAEVFVGSAEGIVRDLKNPATEGAFTPEEADAIKADVLRRLHAALANDLPALKDAIGATSVDEFLDDLLEAKVTALRVARPSAPVAAAMQTTVTQERDGAASSTTVETLVQTGDPSTSPASPPSASPEESAR